MNIMTTEAEILAAIEGLEYPEIDHIINRNEADAREEGGLWMNPATGSVDTWDNWACGGCEMEDLEELIQVTYCTRQGAWIEKE